MPRKSDAMKCRDMSSFFLKSAARLSAGKSELTRAKTDFQDAWEQVVQIQCNSCSVWGFFRKVALLGFYDGCGRKAAAGGKGLLHLKTFSR